MKTSTAIYALSGDPITNGHIHIIKRAAELFSELIVGIGVNPTKKYLFTLEERFEMAKNALQNFKNIKVIAFKGLLIDYAFENNIPVIVRGVRNNEDFNMELLIHQIGESQRINIETLFLPSSQHMSHISSSAARALQQEQGIVSAYVPINVKQCLEERISGQYIIGVTGEIGSGKSFISAQLLEQAQKLGIPMHRIDMDKIGHEILESLTEPLYKELRDQLITEFGEIIKGPQGYIDRKALGKIVFNNAEQLKKLNELVKKPMLLRLRRELYGKRGIILLDAALIAESEMTYLCNNNVILVNTDKTIQLERLKQRGYTDEQIRERMNSQYTHEFKKEYIQSVIDREHHGQIISFENTGNRTQQAIAGLLDRVLKEFVKEKFTQAA